MPSSGKGQDHGDRGRRDEVRSGDEHPRESGGPVWVGGGRIDQSGEELPVCRGGSRRPSENASPAVPTDPEDIALDDRALAGLGHGCRGVFITFEGLDGTGKTTQLEMLAEELREAGHEVVVTREPGGTSLGESIRDALLDTENRGISARAEAFLYTAARVQLVEEVIRPALEEGKIVLCDRYVDSSLAYQGYGRDLGYENIIAMNMWATDGLMPDLTVVLLAPEAVRRRRLDVEPDRVESSGEAFFQRVEQGYRRLVSDHPHRMVALDAGGAVEEVARRVIEVVHAELGVEFSDPRRR